MNNFGDIELKNKNKAELQQSARELAAKVRRLSLEESKLRVVLRYVQQTIRHAFDNSRALAEELNRRGGVAARIDAFLGRDRDSTGDNRPADERVDLTSPLVVV